MIQLKIVLIALFLLFPSTAKAACTSPAGVAGEQIYNTSEKVMQFCNGADWVAMTCGEPTGTSPCTAPEEGQQQYNFGYKVMQFCDGTNWIAMSCFEKGNVCTLPWGGEINDGLDITAYQNATEPFGSTCTSETRNCFNGTLDGTYTNQNCTVSGPSGCTLPWGGSIASGADVTAYLNASEPFGGSCTSETRNCNNGTLDGAYTNQNCSVDDDTTPDSFDFVDQTNVDLSTSVQSNIETISGITGPTAITISGQGTPEFRINGGAWVTSGSISNGQTLQLRLTSSGSSNTSQTATVNVGGVSNSFTVTTLTLVSCTADLGGGSFSTVAAPSTTYITYSITGGGGGGSDAGSGGRGGATIIDIEGSTVATANGGNANSNGTTSSGTLTLNSGESLSLYIGGGGGGGGGSSCTAPNGRTYGLTWSGTAGLPGNCGGGGDYGSGGGARVTGVGSGPPGQPGGSAGYNGFDSSTRTGGLGFRNGSNGQRGNFGGHGGQAGTANLTYTAASCWMP